MKYNLSKYLYQFTCHTCSRTTQRWSDWVVVVVVVLAVVLADILGLPPPSLISLSLTSLYFSQLARLSLHRAGWAGEQRKLKNLRYWRYYYIELGQSRGQICQIISILPLLSSLPPFPFFEIGRMLFHYLALIISEAMAIFLIQNRPHGENFFFTIRTK